MAGTRSGIGRYCVRFRRSPSTVDGPQSLQLNRRPRLGTAPDVTTEDRRPRTEEQDSGVFERRTVYHLFMSTVTNGRPLPMSYTHLRAHETPEHLVCRLL